MRYDNTPIIFTPSGKRAYRNVRYPDIPLSENDIYLYATESDRLDRLALRFYKDQSLWWVIALGNPSMDLFTIFPPTPKRIRIPSGINSILGEFDRINNTNLLLDYNLNITRNKSTGIGTQPVVDRSVNSNNNTSLSSINLAAINNNY